MSAIGGTCNFDGEPVGGEILSALGEGLASLGPDGGSHFKSGPIGMVYRAFHTNRESRLETQPVVSNDGHILCWDGRLDNREELISALRDNLHGEHTDAAIVMAAYLKWGIDFLPKLIADFALSLWDFRSRSLLLARDVIGSRDLYYYRNSQFIVWSSELSLVLDLSGVEMEVDDNYIAGYLTRGPEPWQTPFKKIQAVPPAHALILTNKGLQVRRFWALDPTREIRYKTDTEYEEHFVDLFRGAVKCHLRADRPVWADLSGGLDSSSIVCMADQLIKLGKAEAPRLETVSCIRDESPSSNESKFIGLVEERIGAHAHHLPESKYPVLSPLAVEPSVIPNALDLFASYHHEVDRLMADADVRVRLCGNGGDEVLYGDPTSELTDFLIQGKVVRLDHSLRYWSSDRKKPYVKLFWQDAFLPILPRKLQIALKHDAVKRLPDWVDRSFVARTKLQELMFGPHDAFGFRQPSSRAQSISFLSAVRELSAGYLRALQHVDIRLPFLHRPLVEFMQAIPRDQRARPRETRSLQRRALRDLLPLEVLKRKGKGNPAEAIFRAVSREYPRLLALVSDSYVARYGYVNQQALITAFTRMRYGDRKSIQLFRIIPLEIWLRSLENPRPRARMNAAVMGLPEARPAVAG